MRDNNLSDKVIILHGRVEVKFVDIFFIHNVLFSFAKYKNYIFEQLLVFPTY